MLATPVFFNGLDEPEPPNKDDDGEDNAACYKNQYMYIYIHVIIELY